MHGHTTRGKWALQLLHCTATLPRGNGRWNSCNAQPQLLGVLGSATPAMHQLTAFGSGQYNAYNALPHSLEAVGS